MVGPPFSFTRKRICSRSLPSIDSSSNPPDWLRNQIIPSTDCDWSTVLTYVSILARSPLFEGIQPCLERLSLHTQLPRAATRPIRRAFWGSCDLTPPRFTGQNISSDRVR